MTYTYTTTESFTRTHAVYLASKVAADVSQMQLFYGQPSDAWIDAYVTEVVVLLVNHALGYIEYGFKRGINWVVATKYTARSVQTGVADDKSGRIPPDANVSGASWTSFLTYSDRWGQLTQAERDKISSQLPFQRTAGTEPSTANGSWALDKSYSRNGIALDRGIYRS